MRTRWHCTLSDAVNSVRMERERADWVMPAVPFLVPDDSVRDLPEHAESGTSCTSYAHSSGPKPALLIGRPDLAPAAGLTGSPPRPRFRSILYRRRRVFAHLPPRINARPSSIPSSG